MEEIFTMIFELFLTLWQGIGGLFEPLIEFIVWAAPIIINVITTILSFIFECASALIEGIVTLFGFIGYNPGNFGGFGGGGHGGGGGSWGPW